MNQTEIVDKFLKLNPKKNMKDLFWRVDGRLEWHCKCGIGHTVYSLDNYFIHGCCGIHCKDIKIVYSDSKKPIPGCHKMIPKHYHLTLLLKERGTKELVVSEHEGRWNVIDEWGEITGESDGILKTFDDAKSACSYAYKELKRKFDGTIITGAGCPPNEWIQEFEEDSS